MEEEKNEVVISGIGCLLPDSINKDEFKRHLLEKTNLVTVSNERWAPGEMGVPAPIAVIKDVNNFDSSFFGVSMKLSHRLDVITKMSMERSCEAIMDAGVHISELSGTRTAVVMASCISESEFIMFDTQKNGFHILGHNRSMQANRVSFALNLSGPSFTIDSSWIGGIQALQIAYDLIKNGHCNSAIVGVANRISHPFTSIQYLSIGKLNYSGLTKSFCDDADGYARAEGCVAFFLQNAKQARRCYGTILGINSINIGLRESSYISLSKDEYVKFLKKTYSDAGVDPSEVSYLEADGSANKYMDALELNGAAEVMCKNRKSGPLLVGSVKTNVGHAEASASLVSVLKGLIALDDGEIPPNLHYTDPNKDVKAFKTGDIKVVTETTALPGPIIGVTSFGLVGNVGHIILKQNLKVKKEKKEMPKDVLPRLFIASARQEVDMISMLDKVSQIPYDEEFYSLSYNVWKRDLLAHLIRGYTVLPEIKKEEREYQPVHERLRPVWFIFSGMGSQWNEMGVHLLKLPIFRAAIEKCNIALKQKKIDIFDIITSSNLRIFDNILYSFVGIAAIQVGLVDVMHALGIVPDGIVGHSVGELGCAYADGCFTAEQVILSAYARGKASLETPLIKGMMAAVGLGYEQMKKEKMPESIDIACHNSDTSCTLSGPAEDMEKYIEHLKSRKIFARLVNVANIAYHSRYIKDAAPALLRYLKDVIPHPKSRSSKWICSSIPEKNWNMEMAKYSSPEYFANNLLSPVLFEEACEFIPDNAVVIEIAPHGLLQAILRKSLKLNCTSIALTQRGSNDGLRFLLRAIGKLYMNGLLPDLMKLYPEVEYPVSRRTPSLATFVSWYYQENLVLDKKQYQLGKGSGEQNFKISIYDEKYAIYQDHRIGNSFVIPNAAYLMLVRDVWMSYSLKGEFVDPIMFENIRIFDLVELKRNSDLNISICCQRGSGLFEVIHEDRLIMSGKFNLLEFPETELSNENTENISNKEIYGNYYTSQQVYNVFKRNGLEHLNSFCTIKEISVNHQSNFIGSVNFDNNWIQFLEGVFKLHSFVATNETNKLNHVTTIKKLVFDPNIIKKGPVKITYNKLFDTAFADGLKIAGVKVNSEVSFKSFYVAPNLILQECVFLSHTNLNIQDLVYLSNICVQLITENYIKNTKSYKNVSVLDFEANSAVAKKFASKLHGDLQLRISLESDYLQVDDAMSKTAITQLNIFIVADFRNIQKGFEILSNNKNGFLLGCFNKECNSEDLRDLLRQKNIGIVFTMIVDGIRYILYRKTLNFIDKPDYKIIDVSNINWSYELDRAILDKDSEDRCVYVCLKKEPSEGVFNFIKNIRNKYIKEHIIRFVFLLDESCPQFSPMKQFYSKHLALNLKVNVFKNGSWGNYYKTDWKQSVAYKKEDNTILYQLLFTAKCNNLKLNLLGLNLKYFTISEDGHTPFEIGTHAVEYCGTTEDSKNRVFGLAKFSDILWPDKELVWKVPSNWKNEDAVTVPYVYTLAYYSLVELGEISPEKVVLIHCGFSPFGQACINVALKNKCKIITTYFTPEQAEFIKRKYPQINENNIIVLNSNILIELMKNTDVTTLDCVINLFDGKSTYFENTLDIMKYGAKYITLGVNSANGNSSIGLQVFLQGFGFLAINPFVLLDKPIEIKLRLKELVENGIEDGTVKPIENIINPNYNIICEMSCLKSPFTMKKMIFDVASLRSSSPPSDSISMAELLRNNKYMIDRDHTIVIISDADSLLLDLFDWLCARGARRFIIGIRTEDFSSLEVVKRLTCFVKEYNTCSIQLLNINQANTEAGANCLFSQIQQPIEAIFFVNINDSLKIRLFDKAIRNLNLKISKFVCLLSNGNDICKDRLKHGYPATIVEWERPLAVPSHIIASLDDIFKNKHCNHFVITEQTTIMNLERKIKLLAQSNLTKMIPQTIEHVITYGLEDCGEMGGFIEVQTFGPGFNYVKDASPVLIVPGLVPNQLDKFITKINYPVFKAVIPYNVTSVNDAADVLIKSIKNIKRFGEELDSFTLIGVGWGGLVAMKIAEMFDQGNDKKGMTVILLDAEPNSIKAIANAVMENHDINYFILNKYFPLMCQDESLFENRDWKDCLDSATKYGVNNKDPSFIKHLKHGLIAIRNRLIAITEFDVARLKQLIHTQIYLYSHANSLDNTSKFRLLSVRNKIIKCEEEDLQMMLENQKILHSIRKNLIFHYPNTEFLETHIKNIEKGIENSVKINSILVF